MFISKSAKSKFYQITYEVNGKRTTKSTGTTDRKKAEIYLEEFKRSLFQFTPQIIIPAKDIKSEFRLSDFQKEYSTFVTPIKSKPYVKSINLSFRQFINFVGDISLSDVNPKTIDQFVTHTFGRTKRGAHLYFRTLKAAFTKAVSWNYIQSNPFQKIKFPRLQKNYPLFITLEDIEIIITNTKEEFLKDLFTTAFYTGMRLGEIVNLQWSWVDLAEKVIYVRCSESFQTKSKKERIIPINETLESVLLRKRELIHVKEFVFTNEKGRRLNEDFVSKKFKKYIRACGMNDQIHFHTLRHSFASRLVQKGAALEVIKELLGHEDLSTTQIYAHLQQQNLLDAVNLL